MAIARHKPRQRELREARGLIRRVQRGDRRAFELLYAAYEGRLYRFCHRLTGSEDSAQALVQATFPRALANLPEAGLATLDVPAYLHGTARALAHERNGLPGAEPGEDIAAANLRLAPRQRAVLALRDLEGRPDAEIAGVLGTGEADVPALAARARLRLRDELGLPPVVAGCRDHLAELAAYADGTLPAERHAEVETHIAGCAGCRAALFALREATLRYRALPSPEPEGELGARTARALGAVGIAPRRIAAAAAEPGEAGGRQTVAAAAMAALVIVGAGVTIAASRDSHDGAKPSPAPVAPPPQPQPSAPADPPASPSSPNASIASNKTVPRPAPPVVHHLRAGPLQRAVTRKPPLFPGAAIPAPDGAPPGTSAAPAAPPATPAKPPRQAAQIPVEILPPVAPAHPPTAADTSPSPPAPEPPPPPDQTTTT